MADSDLAGFSLRLRLIGERLHSVGGWPLLEHAIARLAPDDGKHAEGRRILTRACWHGLGEHLG